VPACRLRVLGPLQVDHPVGTTTLGLSKAREVLGLLVAMAPSPVTVDAITDALWGAEPPATSRKAVQKYIGVIRGILGHEAIESHPHGYALRFHDTDVLAFRSMVAASYECPTRESRQILEDALALWRGEAFEDIRGKSIGPMRSRLREERLLAADRLVDLRLELGEHSQLVAELELAANFHTTREVTWLQLMRALVRCERPDDALRAFDRLRRNLAAELGIEPSNAICEFEQQILSGAATYSSSRGPSAAPPSLRLITIVGVETGSSELTAETHSQVGEDIEAIVEELEGFVIHVLGKTTVACFGLPSHEDDAQRGVQLAQRIVEMSPGSRAAVATGWALVEPNSRGAPRVSGVVLEELRQLLAETGPSSVAIDESTAELGSTVEQAPMFVGRHSELALLSAVVHQATSRSRAQLTLVHGEPGIGKTRLVKQLCNAFSHDSDYLWMTCGETLGAHTSIADLIHTLLGSPSTREFGLVEATVDRCVADPSERTWAVGQLREATSLLPGAPIDNEELAASLAAVIRPRVVDRPLILVLDDLHRASERLLSVVEALVARSHDCPLVTVGITRADCRLTLGARSVESAVVRLGGLDIDEIVHILRDLDISNSLSATDQHVVASRSGGNPLFAMQLAKEVRHQGWAPTVPASLQKLITSRLDALAPLESAIASAIAVAGGTLDRQHIAEIVGVGESTLIAPLELLESRGLLKRSGRSTAFDFAHGLLCEVAYAQLPRAALARLHEAVASTLTRSGENARDTFVLEAMHYSKAAAALEESDQTSGLLRQRALEALKAAANERELDLRSTPQNASVPSAVAGNEEVATAWGQAYEALRRGEPDIARDHCLGALTGSDRPDAGVAEARLQTLLGEALLELGDYDGARTSFMLAESQLSGHPPSIAVAELSAARARVESVIGDASRGEQLAQRGIEVALVVGDARSEIGGLHARGIARLRNGELAGYDDLLLSLRRALSAGLSHETAVIYNDLSYMHWQGQGPTQALELCERGLELAERRGLRLARDWLDSMRAQIFFDAGRWDELLAIADEFIDRPASGYPAVRSTLFAARVSIWRGDLSAANRLLRFTVDAARRQAAFTHVGPALIINALFHAVDGRLHKAGAIAVEYCELAPSVMFRVMEEAELSRIAVRCGTPISPPEMPPLATARSSAQLASAAAVRSTGLQPHLYLAAAEKWRTFGNPNEELLALCGAKAVAEPQSPALASARGERLEQLQAKLQVDSSVLAAIAAPREAAELVATTARTSPTSPGSEIECP
jgi:DNA-binding SARP family transcriptional activator/tetratricopeptide (TPR) repeat protein